ncbi:MAG: hypothetical protein EBT63_00490 [Proteobacteria bacterium]|nr:hypothetical protein [Pseudomonadota bacterium]NCA27949.1 hypothetical protein [Pseudomonadota bacterium]
MKTHANINHFDINSNAPDQSEERIEQIKNNKLYVVESNVSKQFDIDKDAEIHKISVEKAYQLHDHKARMFNWIINMSSYYLIIVLIIFSLSMFEIRKDLDEYWFYIILSSLFLFPPLIQKIAETIFDFKRAKKLSNIDSKKFEETAEEVFDKKTLNKIFIALFSGCFVFATYLLLSKIINIRDSATAPDSAIIIALITSTTGTIIALPAVVAKIIFDEKK